MADSIDPWAAASLQLQDNDQLAQQQQMKAAVQAAPVGTSSAGGLTINKADPQVSQQVTELPPVPQTSPQKTYITGDAAGVNLSHLPSADPWEQDAARLHVEDAVKAGDGHNLVPLLRAAHKLGALPQMEMPQPQQPAPPPTPYQAFVHQQQSGQGIMADVNADMYAMHGWAGKYGQALVAQNNPQFQKWAALHGADPKSPDAAADFLKQTLPEDQVRQTEARFRAEHTYLTALDSRDQAAQAMAEQYRMFHAGAADAEVRNAVDKGLKSIGAPTDGTFPPVQLQQGQVQPTDVSRARGTMDAFLRGAGGLVYKPAAFLEGLAQSVSDRFSSNAAGARPGPGRFESMRNATGAAEAAWQEMLPQSTAAKKGDVWAMAAEGVSEATPGIVSFAATAGGSGALTKMGAGLAIPQKAATAINYGLLYMQQGGQSYQDIYATALQHGMDPKQASLAAGVGSTVDAAVTTYLMKFGVVGEMKAASVRGYLTSIIRSAGAQGGVGAAGDLVSQLTKYAATGENPNLERTLAAAITGAATGGFFAAASPHGVKAAWRDFSGAADADARQAAADAASKAWGGNGGMNSADARTWLNLDPTAPLDRSTVINAWKDKVQEVHPDHGGTADDFQKTLAARAVLLNGLGRAGSPNPANPSSPASQTAAPAPAGATEPVPAEPVQSAPPETPNAVARPAENPLVVAPPAEATPAITGEGTPGPGPTPRAKGQGGGRAGTELATEPKLTPGERRVLDSFGEGGHVTPPTPTEQRVLDAVERRAHPREADPNAPHPAELNGAKAVGEWYSRTFNDPAGADAIEALASMAGHDTKYVLVDVDPKKIDANSLGNGDTNPEKVKQISDLPPDVRDHLPPVIAVPMGDQLTVADGGHRLAAAQQAKWATIKAYVPVDFARRLRFGINSHETARETPSPRPSPQPSPPAEAERGSGLGGKQPWELTKQEFLHLAPRERGESMTIRRGGSKLVPALRINGTNYSNPHAQTHGHVLSPETLEKLDPTGHAVIPGYMQPDNTGEFIYQLPEGAHKQEVKDALARGEDVPEKVLAEYKLKRETPTHEHSNSIERRRQQSGDQEHGREKREGHGRGDEGQGGGQQPAPHEGQGHDQGQGDEQVRRALSSKGPWDFERTFPDFTAEAKREGLDVRALGEDGEGGIEQATAWLHGAVADELLGVKRAVESSKETLAGGSTRGKNPKPLSIKQREALRKAIAEGENLYQAKLDEYENHFGAEAREAIDEHVGLLEAIAVADEAPAGENTGTAVPEGGTMEHADVNDQGQKVLPGGREESGAGGADRGQGQGDVEEGVSGTPPAPPANGEPGQRGEAGGSQLPGPLQQHGGERGEQRPGGRKRVGRVPEPGQPAETTLRVGPTGSGEGISPADAERARQEAPAGNAGNYIIHDPAALEAGGAKTHFKSNVAAIELLRKLQGDGRDRATPAEQDVLAKFSGWGRFPAVFNENDNEWKDERAILKDLLGSDEAWEQAKRSTINAHFTSAQMIEAIYKALTRMGFPGGRLLEPSAGIGKFFGLLPDGMRGRSLLTGVELDKTTAALARYLYPGANIQAKGFQDVQIPDGFFDAAAGNVPFGDIRIHDPAYNKYRAPMHDYFFLKTLDKTRGNGLVAMLTSTGTLDKATGEDIRNAIDERGELVAAARLPDGAFQQVAGTLVVTDLLVFRRRMEGESPSGNFTKLGTLPDPDGGEPIPVNEWFERHPDDILGRLDRKSRMYRGGEMHVSMTDDFEARIEAWLKRIPQDVYKPAPAGPAFKQPKELATSEGKEGGYTVKGGKVYQRRAGSLDPVELEKKQAGIVADTIKVRDALKAVIDGQLEGKSEGDMASARAALKKVYDGFVKQHGALHKKANASAFAGDPDAPVVLALEKEYDPKTQKATLADVFVKNTVRGVKKAQKVDDVGSALPIVLNEVGHMDVDRLAELTGMTVGDVGKDLVAKGLGYKDPAGGWKTAEMYLSGNVRKRLLEAQEAAAADPAYLPNVRALEKVIPEDIDYDQIGVRLGSSWLPATDIKQFAADTIGGIPEHFDVRFLEQNGTWLASYTPTGERRHSHTPQTRQVYGTDRAPFIDVLDRALNGKTFYFTKDGPEPKTRVPDPETTDAANGKIKDLQDAFRAWVWEDDERRHRLARYYNDTFNNIAPVSYDGSHQQFPGMNPAIELRAHQKNAVWEIVSAGTALLGHEVGTGKTYTMVAGALERRRLGLSRKPAIVGPKKNQATIIQQAKALYPAARIHVVEDFDAKGRKEAVSRIATGDYDVVIMTHDHLNMLPMDPAVEQDFIRRELAELEEVRTALAPEEAPDYGRRIKKSKSENRQVKELEKIKARLEERLKASLDSKKDNAVTFEQTGIDMLFVDEAHAYKSLPVYTKHERVKGIPSSANRSDRATNMWMRTQWLQGLNGGQGVVFATGTPITNTMTELYTMQRYLQMKELQDRGISSFDAWASTFGQMNTRTEYTVAGEYKAVTRFNAFINLPELQRISKQVIDVQRAKDLPGFKRPKRKDEVIKVPMSPAQVQYMGVIASRAEAAKKKRPGEKGDNMLSISSDARKSAVDHRLIDPKTDMAGGKVDAIVKNVLGILKDNPGTTQMIFSDFGLHPTERNKFTFFNALHEALVHGGIPADRIVNFTTLTQAQEKTAADRLRDGEAIIGLASSTAGGTGINAQDHMIALHHADVPWLPAYVEQRDGRGWRQGNKNAVVRIFRYVTEGSFDAFMWQAVDAKTRFISQFLEGEKVGRAITEEDGEELTPAQVMAIASGDPLLLDRINLEAEIKELESAEQRHKRQEFKLRDTAVELEKKIAGAGEKEKALEQALAAAKARAKDEFEIVLRGKTYTDRAEADKALANIVDKMPMQWAYSPTNEVIGSFRGFELAAHMSSNGAGARLNVGGVEVFPTASLASIEYYARPSYYEGRLGEALNNRKVWTADLQRLNSQLGRKFPHTDVLKQKQLALSEIQGKLSAKSKGGTGETAGAASKEVGDGESPGVYAPTMSEGVSEGTSKPAIASPVIHTPAGNAKGVAAQHGLSLLRPIAMPELLKLARTLLGKTPLIKKLPRSSALFSAKGTFGQIRIDPRRVKGAFELAKVLAHEVGHLEDWLPNNTLSRGNLIGRIQKLNRYLKDTFGSMTVTSRELKKELVALSEWWTPYDRTNARASYIQYRESPRELYAEALSVLINAPGEVEARAPGFYKAMLEALDRHPEFRDAYLDLQDLLAGTPEQLAAERRQDVREAYRKGEEIIKARAQERIEAAKGSMLMSVRQLLLDALSPALSKQRKAEKKIGGALPPEENAKWAYAELSYADNEAHIWLQAVDEQVHKALGDAGLSADDIGEYLQMFRTGTERADLANPGGHTPATSKEMLTDLRDRVGPESWKALEGIVKTFHDLVHAKVEEAKDVGYYNENTYKEVLEPNRYRYATFAVLDYLQDSIAPGIAHQVGTFKEVANPYTATVLKTVSLIRAIQLQKAKVPLIRMLKGHFAGEIEKGKPRVGEGGRRTDPGRPPAGREWLIVYENGHPEWYAVDPYISKVFNRNDIGGLNQLAKAIQRITYGTLHPLYVTFNLGWHLRLLPKDFLRAYRNSAFKGNPTTLRELLGAYAKALPSAYRLVRGLKDPVIEQMLEQKALAVPFQQWDFNEQHDTHERMLDRYGLGDAKKHKNPALEIAVKMLHGIEAAGTMLVSTPKIAGWHVLSARGMSGVERSYRVRNFFGHPDRKRRGTGTNLSNGVAMYSNILIQFLRADAEAATDPTTRSGWWIRTLLTTALPKALMAAAAAGLLGAWLKAMFDLIPEADKTKNIIIPLWMTTAEDGKTRKAVYAKIPQDVLGTILGGMQWKMLHQDGKPALSRIQQVLDVPYADGPHMNPYLTGAWAWSDYLRGQNPWDSFRQRNIIPEQDFNAGGWYAGKDMVQWQLSQLGILSTLAHAAIGKPGEGRETTSEMLLGSIPGSFVAESNRGILEREEVEAALDAQEKTRFRLDLPEPVRAATKERYRLDLVKKYDTDPADQYRRIVYTAWYDRVYLPVTKAMAAAKERGDTAEFEQLRASLAESTKSLK